MKNLKKLTAIALASTMLFSMTACSGAAKDETITIGVTLMDYSTEFSIGLKDYMEAKAASMDDVELVFVDAGGDAVKQVAQVESFIAQEVDAIVMQPQEQEACNPAVQKAQEAGIPIVNCNSLTTSDPDAYVGSNDAESAEIAMTYIAEELGGSGNVLMMRGHAGQTAEIMRTEGAMAILEENPNMTLLAEQTAEWSRADAMTLMENWIQAYGDDIDAVFCQNDEMALGAMNALIQAGKNDDIIVVGVDAIPDALTAVSSGQLDATVYQDCQGQAEGSIDAAYSLAKGESVASNILIPFILVTPDNVDEYV